MLEQLRNLIVLVLFCSGLGYFIYKGGNISFRAPAGPQLLYAEASSPQYLARCGPPSADKKPVAFTMVVSAEKEAWLQSAALHFGKVCPNIQVRLVVLDSIQAAKSIAAGTLQPTLWAPSSELALPYARYLRSRAKQPPIPGLERGEPLLSSPMIWLTTEHRYRALKSILESPRPAEGQWMKVGCAMVPRTLEGPPPNQEEMVPGSWQNLYAAAYPDLGQAAPGPPAKALPPQPLADPKRAELLSWGGVKFGHANPVLSLDGLETIALLAYDFVLPPSARTTNAAGSSALKAALQTPAALGDFMRRCEAGTPKFPGTARELVDNFVAERIDPYDIIATHEYAVIPSLARTSRYGDALEPLHVLYPETSLGTDQPVVTLEPSDPSRREEHIAAAKWIAYLMSDVVQQAAIEYGFRPGRTDISIREYKSADNPFLRLATRGVQFELRPHEQLPIDGEMLAELMKIWCESTDRY